MSRKRHVQVKWQEGPIQEAGENGAQIEDVIELLVDRLEGFQAGKFACEENRMAILKLKEAQFWLDERTRKRKKQGVEGTNQQHQ